MNVLVIAPHADDEILGVGGTIAKYADLGHKVFVVIASRGYEPLFQEKLVQRVLEESEQSHKALGVHKTYYLNLPASRLEHVTRDEINTKLYEVIKEVKPNIVFIPHYGDMQKDHEIIAKCSMVVLRPKYNIKVSSIYSYETVSETEWNIPHVTNSFIPNVYIDITEYIDKKIAAMSEYKSQLSDFPSPRSLENLIALAKVRGSTIEVKAAEAFALIREII